MQPQLRNKPTAAGTGEAWIDAYMALASPQMPSQRLPRRVRRLIPDPQTESGFLRFTHADVHALSRGQRNAEAFAIRMALAEHLDREPPSWLLRRLERLIQAGGDLR